VREEQGDFLAQTLRRVKVVEEEGDFLAQTLRMVRDEEREILAQTLR
jgi:hypothetical protein